MKTAVILAPFVVAAGVLFASETPIQPITPPSSGGNYYGGGGYGGRNGASTVAGSALNGMGNLVRARGEANLSNSAAAINYTAAQRNAIQNYSQRTSTYFEMRAYNRQARAAERGPRATMEQLVRFAQAGKPKPLSPSEVDTVTGTVDWPRWLKSDEFSADRQKLEKLFSERAHKGGLGRTDYMKAREVTEKMLAALKTEVRDTPPADYVASKQFLQSLAYAAGQPTG